MRIWNRGVGVLCTPLIRACRALLQIPFEVEKVFEVVIAPLRRRLRPDDLWTTSDRIAAKARAVFAPPAEALIFNLGALRLRTHKRRIAGAVSFAEGMSAGDKSDGFLVIHRHACECLANVVSSSDWIGLTVRTFGIDIDKAHLHRAERFLKLTFAAVAFVAKPCSFRTPV